MIKDEIKKAVRLSLSQFNHDGAKLEIKIEKPKNDFGDYATNVAFALASILKKSPESVAQQITEKISGVLPAQFENVSAHGGYVNFFLKREFLIDELRRIDSISEGYGHLEVGGGKLMIVEFSQPNIAKKMHVGHLRNTVLGDALSRLMINAGYKVVRWNYLGDWGTQFGNLIAAYKKWGNAEKLKTNPINEMLALYVRFHEEMKQNKALAQEGREEFSKLEQGDTENTNLWLWFRGESMKEFNKLYTILGVSFDVEYGESFYNDRTAELIERMQKNGIAVEDDGALVVKLDKNNLPPVIIRKTDGATLYHTRDIANIEYRLGEYHPDKILYVVGNEQTLHFQQLFAVAELMGIGVTKLEHIKYGLLLDESGKKFATREGRATLADELIDQAIKLASDIIGDKNPKMATEQKARTAEAIGISALKYALLKDHRNTDIVFSWEQILDFNGNSGPYLQYTYARFAKILASASPVGRESVKTELLVGPTELDLIKKIIDLPDILERAVAQRLTNGLTLYLYELAVMANSYYEKTHILGGENRQLQEARLLLIKNVLRAMAKCFELLNLTILEEV